MKNRELAQLLHEMSILLEVEGKDRFKPRAYARAARAVSSLGEDIESIAARGELTDIPGVGKSIAKKIEEYLRTGRIEKLEALREKIPVKVAELEAIPGVGPKTIKTLYESLGVTDLDSLEAAIREGRLKGLRGIGTKTIEQISEGIALVRAGMSRVLLSDALALAESLVEHIRSQVPVKRIDIAGSVRRRKETIGDIDILVCADDGEAVAGALMNSPETADVLVHGDTKTSVRLRGGTQVDLRLLAEESYGAGLQYFTGSKDHNVHLRSIAMRKGLRLNEYGLFDKDRMVAGREEQDIYSTLGLQFIPPELREDRGEIEAAQKNELPILISPNDIKGDLHVHTNQSDGANTLEEMVTAAEVLGHEYLCISDHSKSLTIAGGLDEGGLLRQMDRIDELNASGRWRVRILKGIEVDILPSGELDLDDSVLSQLDVVVASVHSHLKDDRATMTERVVTALGNRHVDILGHPTGRMLLRRPRIEIDLERVFEAARENQVIMELNSHPVRLDLNDANLRLAKEMGLLIAINTDSHRTQELENLRFGVAQARRGWLTAEDVINTRSVDDLLRMMS